MTSKYTINNMMSLRRPGDMPIQILEAYLLAPSFNPEFYTPGIEPFHMVVRLEDTNIGNSGIKMSDSSKYYYAMFEGRGVAVIIGDLNLSIAVDEEWRNHIAEKLV